MTDLQAIAERALRLAPATDGLQVTVTRERSLFMRFARSRPTQATAVDDVGVEVAAVRDGHVGTAAAGRTDDDGLVACVRSAAATAEAAARAAPDGGGYPGLPGPQQPRAHDGFDAATAAIEPEVGGAAVAAAVETCRAAGVEAFGVWTAASVETAIASTTGLAAQDRVTDAFMKVVPIAPGGRSGWAAGAAVAASALDPGALAADAAARATGAHGAGGEPARVAAGELPVVLAPDAVGQLLDWLGWMAFDGLAFAEERSALNGRLGTRVAAPAINLADSPRSPGTLPRAFDAEGVPKAPLPLIQDGVAHAVVHDTRSAARAGGGARSTAHALAPGGSGAGPAPTNLVLAGGGAADEHELCAGIDRGVYVTRLWYLSAVRPKETILTGVTRDGTYLIEAGRIGPPLEDLRFTDSALRILGRTEALTANRRLVTEGEFYGRRHATGVLAPALRASAMRFTDAT